jgi:hypothetical protein
LIQSYLTFVEDCIQNLKKNTRTSDKEIKKVLSLIFVKDAFNQFWKIILESGTDKDGRNCLAGAVTAAAVLLAINLKLPSK